MTDLIPLRLIVFVLIGASGRRLFGVFSTIPPEAKIFSLSLRADETRRVVVSMVVGVFKIEEVTVAIKTAKTWLPHASEQTDTPSFHHTNPTFLSVIYTSPRNFCLVHKKKVDF
jgi:hypothetical protein